MAFAGAVWVVYVADVAGEFGTVFEEPFHAFFEVGEGFDGFFFDDGDGAHGEEADE